MMWPELSAELNANTWFFKIFHDCVKTVRISLIKGKHPKGDAPSPKSKVLHTVSLQTTSLPNLWTFPNQSLLQGVEKIRYLSPSKMPKHKVFPTTLSSVICSKISIPRNNFASITVFCLQLSQAVSLQGRKRVQPRLTRHLRVYSSITLKNFHFNSPSLKNVLASAPKSEP